MHCEKDLSGHCRLWRWVGADTLVLAQWGRFWTSDLQNYKINLCCFKLLSLWWAPNGDFHTTGPLLSTPTVLATCVSLSNQHCFLILYFSGIFLTGSSRRQGLTFLTSHFSGRLPCVTRAYPATPSYHSSGPICEIREPWPSCVERTLQLENCTGPWPLFMGLGTQNCFYIYKKLFGKSETKHVTPALDPQVAWRGVWEGFLSTYVSFIGSFLPQGVKKENLIDIHTKEAFELTILILCFG